VSLRTIHGLEEEVPEVEAFEQSWIETLLWEDELQLISPIQEERGVGLRTDAEPIYALRGRPRAVRFDGDCEADRVKSLDELVVELEERLPSRTDD
jgi:hypothetical protein